MPVHEDVLVRALELLLMREPRATEVAALDQKTRQVAGRDMVVVGAVVHQRLPVDGLEPFHRAKGLHATVPSVKDRIQVPARVTQIGFEARGIRCPGSKHDPGIGVDAGLDEAQQWPVQRIVIGLGFSGDIL